MTLYECTKLELCFCAIEKKIITKPQWFGVVMTSFCELVGEMECFCAIQSGNGRGNCAGACCLTLFSLCPQAQRKKLGKKTPFPWGSAPHTRTTF
ncbi:MAG: hypothetical protein J6D21_00600 [Clostridia bacterium]|nr:hypothetical protein [Clostridia bacterium]